MKRLLGSLLLVGMTSSWGLQAAQSAAAQNQEEVVVVYQDAPLIQAVFNGDVDTVACLLADPSVDVNARNSQGRTAFMLIPFAPQNHAQLVDLFLASERVDVNAQDAEGYTALMLIAFYRYQDLTITLIRNPRIDSDLRDNGGRTMIDLMRLQAQRFEQELMRRIELARQAEQEAAAAQAMEAIRVEQEAARVREQAERQAQRRQEARARRFIIQNKENSSPYETSEDDDEPESNQPARRRRLDDR